MGRACSANIQKQAQTSEKRLPGERSFSGKGSGGAGDNKKQVRQSGQEADRKVTQGQSHEGNKQPTKENNSLFVVYYLMLLSTSNAGNTSNTSNINIKLR